MTLANPKILDIEEYEYDIANIYFTFKLNRKIKELKSKEEELSRISDATKSTNPSAAVDLLIADSKRLNEIRKRRFNSMHDFEE